MSEEEENTPEMTLTEGYTAGQAAKVMSRNSGRPVSADLVKKLGQKGVIRSFALNSRLNLYNREDVDKYIVEERGAKAGRAAQTRAKHARNKEKNAA